MLKLGLYKKKKISFLNVNNKKKYFFLDFFFIDQFLFLGQLGCVYNYFFIFFNFYFFLNKKFQKNFSPPPSKKFFLFVVFFSKKKILKGYSLEKNFCNKRFFLDFKNYKEIFYPDLSKFHLRSSKLELCFLPFWMTRSFSLLTSINYVQTKIFPIAIGSDLNLMVCSPTGTGKTLIAGFCILRIIINSSNKKNSKWKLYNKFIRILYIAPMKTLVKEIAKNFSVFFKTYGLNIFEITSEISVNFSTIMKSNIIIGIPEKIELLSKSIQISVFFSQVKLLIVDEIHILNEERGAILEKLLLRFLIEEKKGQNEKKYRILGLSATFPNFLDIGKFLAINLKKGIFYFGVLFRKISLHQTLIGLKKTSLFNKRKNFINEITQKKVQEIFNRNIFSRVIIFVQSRKDTLKTACYLSPKRQEVAKKLSKHKKNSENFFYLLAELEEKKIGIHHAGLSKYRKEKTEKLFKEGKLEILVSTSTLAWGVNLPASHVIIKGTRIYNPKMSAWREVSDLNIIQMLGRAGRFSSTENSEGIVITSYRNLIHYMSLIHDQMPIESQIISYLPDSFNTECACKRIKNVLAGLNWFSKTYFFVRFYRFLLNQRYFSFKNSFNNLENHLKRIFVSQIIKELKGAGMLVFDIKKGFFFSTSTGLVASDFFVNHQTIFLFLSKIKPYLNYCELIYLLSLSKEFSDLKARNNEQNELLRLEKLIFFPVKKTSDISSYRTNILIQAFIGNIRIFSATLDADSVFIGKTSSRLFRAFFKIVLLRRWASLVNKSFEIFQAIYTRTWPSQLSFRAFLNDPLDDKYIKILEKKKINTETLRKFSKKEIENILHSKRGASLITKISNYIPSLKTTLNLQPITRNTLRISLSILIELDWKINLTEKKIGFWIFLEDQICDTLVFHNFFFFKKKKKKKNIFLNFYVPIFDNPISPYYFLKIKCDNKIRSNLEIPIDLTCIQFPNNHPFETKELGFFRSSFTRIFSGFRAGKILAEYFETHQLKTVGFFYQIITYILKSQDHKIINFVQNKIQLILKELAFFSYFSTKKKNAFIYISSGSESLKLNKCQLQGCSIGILGISIEKIGKNNKIMFSCSKAFSFFILSLFELATIEFKLKNSFSSTMVFIVDFFHLFGNRNHNYSLEYFCEAFIFSKILKSKIRLIVSLFPILNSLEFLSWLNIKTHQIISYQFQCEKNLEKKIKFNSNTNFFLNYNSQLKLSNERQSNLLVFNNNKAELKRDFLQFLSNTLFFKTFFLPRRSFFFQRVFLDKWTTANILKIFFGLKIGFLVDYWKFYKRRLMEENFVSNFSKIFFLNTSMFGFVSCEKLSCDNGISVLNHHLFKKTSVSFFFHSSFIRRCKHINVFSKCYSFSIKNLSSFQLTTESILIQFIKEKMIRFVAEKENQSTQYIENKLMSTFYSSRLSQNPQFYGFTKKISVTHFVKKITKILTEKYQGNFLFIKNHKDEIKPTFFGLILCFYFFPQKIAKNLFSSLGKKISSLKITKIILKINEFLFFKIILKKNPMKNKLLFTKHLFQKVFGHSSGMVNFKNQIFSLKSSLKRFFEAWLAIFNPKMNFKNVMFLAEINQAITSNFIKKIPELRQTNIFTNLSEFLFGKIHNIYLVKSIDKYIEIFYDRKKSKKNIKFLKNWLEKIPNYTKLKIKITIRKKKKNKNVSFALNISKILLKTSILFSYLYHIIDFNPFSSFWWLLVGDINDNSIYISTKIIIKKGSIVNIKIFFTKNERKLKFVFINNKFPFLSKELKTNLLILFPEKVLKQQEPFLFLNKS